MGTVSNVNGATGAGATHQHSAAQTTTQGTGATTHSAMPKVPPKNAKVIRTYLTDGSYGDVVKKGKAKNIKIPDGKGFGGVTGRKQNDDDKSKNNYSVTDANFYNMLGVLNDVKTGKPLNYVQQIQAYNAAGYVATFHPDIYAKMSAAQEAGQGTILGMSLNLMGVQDAQIDPGMAAAGLATGTFATETVPGSPLRAKDVVLSGKDIAGEEWARPHHAESSWGVYKKLTDAGLDWKTSMVLSGDDAISGSGRLNGFNGQDGKDGFNDDEAAVYRMAAVAQQATGIPVLETMIGGHAHTNLDPSAKTKPAINELIGLDKNDRSASPDRVAKIKRALLDGTIKGGNAKKFAINDKGAFKGAGGNSDVLQYAISQVAGAKGGDDIKVKKDKFEVSGGGAGAADVPAGGGAGAPDVPAGGGCAHDPVAGAELIGGGPADMGSIVSVLQQLIQVLNQLVAALGAMQAGVAGASGGGAAAPGKTAALASTAQTTTAQTTTATQTAQHAHA